LHFGELVKLPQVLQTIINELPDAGNAALAYFAEALGRAAAGAVEQLLGAAGDGAEAAEIVDDAVAAGLAKLLPDPVFHGAANAGGVDPGKDLEVGVAGHDVLGPDAAGNGDHRVGVGHQVIQCLDVFRVALPFAGIFLHLQLAARGLAGNPQFGGQDRHFLLTAHATNRDATFAAGHHNLFKILDLFQDFRQGL